MLKNELLKLKKVMENKIEFYLKHKIETSDLIEQYRKLNSLIIKL